MWPYFPATGDLVLFLKRLSFRSRFSLLPLHLESLSNSLDPNQSCLSSFSSIYGINFVSTWKSTLNNRSRKVVFIRVYFSPTSALCLGWFSSQLGIFFSMWGSNLLICSIIVGNCFEYSFETVRLASLGSETDFTTVLFLTCFPPLLPNKSIIGDYFMYH